MLGIAKAQSKTTILSQKHFAQHVVQLPHKLVDWHHRELSYHRVQAPTMSEFDLQLPIDSKVYQRHMNLQH